MAILYKKTKGVFVMKKTSKILVSLFIFINIFTINIFAEDLAYIEDALINIGIGEEYSENIVQYLKDINITESKFQKIEYNINNMKDFVEKIKNEEEISFFKYYTAYKNIMNIAKMLNLDLDIDFNSLSFTLIDKKSDNILFEGDTNSLAQIYSNYKDSGYDINMAEILQDINSNNIEEEINNSEEQFDNEINNSLNIEGNTNNNSEINDALDEYIDKFEKYNESLSVKNNNDMLELKIILFIFGVALTAFIVFKIISKVKRLQES